MNKSGKENSDKEMKVGKSFPFTSKFRSKSQFRSVRVAQSQPGMRQFTRGNYYQNRYSRYQNATNFSDQK